MNIPLFAPNCKKAPQNSLDLSSQDRVTLHNSVWQQIPHSEPHSFIGYEIACMDQTRETASDAVFHSMTGILLRAFTRFPISTDPLYHFSSKASTICSSLS